MKKLQKYFFPLLLVATCCIVYCWQHGLPGLILPYLPNKEPLSLGLLSPTLLILTFLTTFVLLKQSGAKKPVVGAIISTAAMLLPVLLAGLYFLNYAAHRYAGVLPVITFPELPMGYAVMAIAALCVLHLTGLLIARFVKQKTKPDLIVLSTIGWVLLNCFLFILTA
ncbi:MAG: hypothetical protein J5781_03940 [Clostridia bacterium]|nr:hypothetical protein [Clostridia bacterium]